MSPLVTIGNLCIGLAVALSLFGIIAFYAARLSDSGAIAALARGTVYGNFVLMMIANLAMVYALLGDDFSVSYVAHVGSRETPRWISAISLWSSLEGSILFWGLVLSAYAGTCIYLHRHRREPTLLWVGLTLLVVELFFFLLLALPANPFLPVSPVPDNGPGPNPLLQNHWLMAVHPPCLYVGYIGLTVPFTFAIATLLEGDRTASWLGMTRRWTLFAWSFLSLAIVLGGWWSYAVLGWGGYWAWDPVENASFMPWLSATALVHSVMVQERRKMLGVWNLFLAILTFLLTLLGTFLTRSGVLDSVHSFTESQVGPYFLIFIGLTLAISLALLLWRAPLLRPEGRFESLLSLDFLILFNNLLFLSFCFIVFLGTLFPLVVEALQGRRISVGEPYFNQMTVPIVGMILLLMGIGLLIPWRRGNWGDFFNRAKGPALLGLAASTGTLLLGGRHPAVVLIVALVTFVFFVMTFEVVQIAWRRSAGRLNRFPLEGIHLLRENPRRYGGFVAHGGILLIILGVTFSSVYEKDQEIRLRRGESAEVGGYSLTLREIRADDTPQRFEVKAVVAVSQQGEELEPLWPQMNFYPTSREPIASPAIRSRPFEDLYVTLLQFEKDGSAASFRIMVTPAAQWIWIGGGVVMLGGLLALGLGRRKLGGT